MKTVCTLLTLALVVGLFATAPLAAQDLTGLVEKFIEPREFTGKLLNIHSADNGNLVTLKTADTTVTLSATGLYVGLIRTHLKFFQTFAETDSMITVKADSNFAITAVMVETEVVPLKDEWTIGGKRRFWVMIGVNDQIPRRCELRSDVKLNPYSPTTLKLKVWVEEGKTYVATIVPDKPDPAIPSPVNLPFTGDR